MNLRTSAPTSLKTDRLTGGRMFFPDIGGARRPGLVSVTYAPDDGGGTGDGGQGGDGGDEGGDGGQQAPTRPDYLPESFWDQEAGTAKVEDLARGYSELAQFKADQDARLQGLPESADKYELGLPEDFQLPDGVKVDIPADAPLAVALKQVAFEHKLPPAALQPLMKAHVESVLGELTAANKAIQDAHARLGEKAADRIGAVTSFAKANLPAEQAEALTDAIHSGFGDRVVSALETLIAKTNTTLPPGGRSENDEAELRRQMYPSMHKQRA